MCDHCAKVTSQKGYAGQVTCKCEHGEKKEEAKKEEFSGCCSKKAKEAVGGCCMSGCCKEKSSNKSKETRKEGANCCSKNKSEINNYKGPPSSMECCSWRQTCCGGGCCEPILPNYYSSKQENVKCSQKAMAASTYGYTSWETTMNGTTMNSIPKSNETIAEKVLCSDVSKPTVCYGGKCDDKTMSQDSNTRNAKEYEETGNGMVSSSTIRYSDR